jgi:hypothetical protein
VNEVFLFALGSARVDPPPLLHTAALDRVSPIELGRQTSVSENVCHASQDHLMRDRNTRRLAAHRELIQEFAVADRDIGGRIDLEGFKLLLEGLHEAGLPATL